MRWEEDGEEEEDNCVLGNSLTNRSWMGADRHWGGVQE